MQLVLSEMLNLNAYISKNLIKWLEIDFSWFINTLLIRDNLALNQVKLMK